MLGAGVLEGVRQRLLGDPVDGEVDARRNVVERAVGVKRHGEAGLAHLADQQVEMAQAWLGRQVLLLARLPQHCDEPPQLRHRRASRRLHREQWRPCFLGVTLERLPGRARLEHHQAHAVGDHVVELAGDPGPLVRNRRLDLLLPCPLKLRGPGLQPVPSPLALEDGLAERPGDRVEDPLAECLAQRARQVGTVGEQLDGGDQPGSDQGPAAAGVGGGRVDDEDLGQEDLEQVRVDLGGEEVLSRPVQGHRSHRQGERQQRVAEAQRQADADNADEGGEVPL